METEQEDLQQNPLFAYLLSRPEIFNSCAKSNYVVCIPVVG